MSVKQGKWAYENLDILLGCGVQVDAVKTNIGGDTEPGILCLKEYQHGGY